MMFMSLLVSNGSLLDEAPVSVRLSVGRRPSLTQAHAKCSRGSSRPHSKQMWDNVMLPASSASFRVARCKPRTHPGGFASFPVVSMAAVPLARAVVLLSPFSWGNPKPCSSPVGGSWPHILSAGQSCSTSAFPCPNSPSCRSSDWEREEKEMDGG